MPLKTHLSLNEGAAVASQKILAKKAGMPHLTAAQKEITKEKDLQLKRPQKSIHQRSLSKGRKKRLECWTQ